MSGDRFQQLYGQVADALDSAYVAEVTGGPWESGEVRLVAQYVAGRLVDLEQRSGEDQRHTHADPDLEVAEQVASRVTLPDGRIVETTETDPPANPPNVVRGNNADL